MTRILHVDHTAAVSGAQHSLLELLDVLRERHRLLLASPPGDLAARARALGIESAVLPGTTGSWRLHPLRTPRALADIARSGLALRRLAAEHEVAVVHANSLRAGLIAAAARRRGGPPFVVHARDVLPPGRAARTVRSVLAREAAAVIAVSDFVAAGWADAAQRPVRIYNPVDAARFRPDPADGAAWRAREGIADGVPLLAVVGQITPWKRQLLAVEAFGALLAELPDARLMIVGAVKFAGPDTALDNAGYLRQVEARIAALGLGASVRLLGEREDVASIMRAADVLLAPADGEPFGRAVGEALATGIPAVVAARGGSAEFLRDAVDGVVVASADAGDWARACRRALELAADGAGAAARRTHACELLDKERHAAAVASVLRAATPRGWSCDA